MSGDDDAFFVLLGGAPLSWFYAFLRRQLDESSGITRSFIVDANGWGQGLLGRMLFYDHWNVEEEKVIKQKKNKLN